MVEDPVKLDPKHYKRSDKSPKELICMDKRKLQDLIEDQVSELEEEGKAPGYIRG